MTQMFFNLFVYKVHSAPQTFMTFMDSVLGVLTSPVFIINITEQV